jgi:hypothetical protein
MYLTYLVFIRQVCAAFVNFNNEVLVLENICKQIFRSGQETQFSRQNVGKF